MMCSITSRLSLKSFSPLAFLLFCSLFITENAFSRDHWERDYISVTYDDADTAVIIRFKFFDYFFGPGMENGYLMNAFFYYSVDGTKYDYLCSSDTNDQSYDSWTWLYMRDRNANAKIQFFECYVPANGSMWTDNTRTRVEVYTTHENVYWLNHAYTAYFTIKWFMGSTNANYIGVDGFWAVNGVYIGDEIKGEVYRIPRKEKFKPKADTTASKNNAVKVFTQGDAIVVTGAEVGENIKVYNVGGTEIRSIVTNKDEIKIRLAKHQVYIVNVGRARYKVVL